jgi:glycosyltransferase involved in cell wall biosynthesis
MLFPSHREGTPNTLFEALHTGRCIVASRADGQGEILRNQMTALLYEPGDVDGLANALRQVLKSADLRELLSSGAERMAKEYDGSACLRRMREVYRELTGPDDPPDA